MMTEKFDFDHANALKLAAKMARNDAIREKRPHGDEHIGYFADKIRYYKMFIESHVSFEKNRGVEEDA